MGDLKGYTDLELAAARRREVIRGSVADARLDGSRRSPERRGSPRDLAWLAASATMALGSRLARG